MKKLTLLLLSILGLQTALAEPIKVACIGNSITFGAGVVNREKNSYPAQLQYALGSGYDVRNFGVSATTLMNSGDNPYIQTSQYAQSLAWQPDVVIIKLGTNDSKDRNRDKLSRDYKKDYQALIDSYLALPSKPRVILCNPVICFVEDQTWTGSRAEYEKIIIPAIESLAYENNLEIIDLYHLFSREWQEHLMPDKLHPSSIGAGMMAERIAQIVLEPKQTLALSLIDAKGFNFHGFQGWDFGAGSKIVSPRRVAQGNPWVLRARFFGHEPQTDIALLERGFHVAYCDVADLYGSPDAIKRYDAFYKQMTALGLNRKVALEAMSRGGLIAFNWAAKNSSKVACIYADAPVMDFKSWPMGVGGTAKSEGDVTQLLKAYGFNSKEEALLWKANPVDHAKALKSVPILCVVGDADEIVPVAENTEVFRERYNNLGAQMRIIHKPGVGHHPHSLFAPREIVNFILRNTNQMINPCIVPVPGNEYRTGAGWGANDDWHSVAGEISTILSNSKVDILLLGNSITQGWVGSRQKVSGAGRDIMRKYSSSFEAAGISGDRTQNLLWRLQNGNYALSSPEKVFITIGVNNLTASDSPEDIAEGIKAVTNEACIQFPDSKIYLFGLLPVGLKADDPMRQGHDKIHSILSKTKFAKNVKYMNLESEFVNPSDKSLKTELYGGDNLHLSPNGYEAWAQIISTL